MELLSKVGRYEFLSEPFHCDYSSHLFMGHLGNHLLNAADFHSNDRGYGMNYLMPRHRTWVLSRLAIEMTEMPKSYDKFAVETWVENAMKYFTARDFKICGASPAGEEEKVYGYGKRHERVACHCFMSFGLCDKNGTASCGYKNQPLSARQTKKSPWQYSLEAFQGILSRIFLAVP